MGNALGPHRTLPKEDLNFLMNNTNFTKKQIKEWYQGFIRDCPSGQLSKKKFIEVYSSFFPTGDADQFCTHVFRTFDKDNSGKIDFNEFLLAINITSGGQPKEKLEWAFQMYDIDGNGTIEKKEMTEIIKDVEECLVILMFHWLPAEYIRKWRISKRRASKIFMLGANEATVDLTPEARTEEIFDKMDSNHDGVLTRKEFMDGCMADQQLYSMLLADESNANS